MTREEINARIINHLEKLGLIPLADLPEKQEAVQPDDLKEIQHVSQSHPE